MFVRVFFILVSVHLSRLSAASSSNDTLGILPRFSRQTSTEKQCEPLNSISLSITCVYYGREVPCEKPMKPSTLAIIECKKNYRMEYEPKYSSVLCKDNGEWDHPLHYCVPECGISIDSETYSTLIIDGDPSYHGKYPWLSSLYLLESNKWKLKCTGTLITRHIVLTVAHCLVLTTNDSPVVLIKPEEIKVGLGKYYSNYYAKDVHSFISDVRDIVIPKMYEGKNTFYEFDIGLLSLAKSVRVTPYIMPACVDWSSKLHIKEGDFGHIAGWGTDSESPSQVVVSAKLKLSMNNVCKRSIPKYRKFITTDKFCTVNATKSQVSRLDHGGGITFVKDEQHFVFGVFSSVISTGPRSFPLFTDLGNAIHKIWLIKSKDQMQRVETTEVKYNEENMDGKKSCTLPPHQQNRQFSSHGCSGYLAGCILGPRVAIPHSKKVVVSCLPDFRIIELTTCEDGKWVPNIPRCIECGKSSLITNRVKRTIGDNYAEIGNFPWHAGVYIKSSDGWKYACGGTLISARIVLTAAHCVVTPCTGCKPKPFDPNDIRIALGKILRGWALSGILEQKKGVKSVHIHEEYQGAEFLFSQDIAMLVLDSDVYVNTYVMPACVDLNDKYIDQLSEDPSTEGYVPGWGGSEECDSSNEATCDKLKYVRTNILDFDNCYNTIRKMRPSAVNRLSNDKFCAGNGSVSILQAGDGGVGLTTVFNGVHYVYGIACVNLQLNLSGKQLYSFSTFTNVSAYVKWLGRLE